MTAIDPGRRLTNPVEAAQFASDTAESAFGKYFLIQFLGLSLDYSDEEKSCTFRLPFAQHLCNAGGGIHGGVLTTVLDISMGHACNKYLTAGSTIDMSVRFMRPVRTDSVCTGRILHGGRKIVQLESRLFDDSGRLAALATGSWFRHDAS